MPESRLTLYPVDPAYAPAQTALIVRVLTGTGLAGNRFQEDRYLVGDRFLELITFLGCSPHIRLDPGEGDPREGNLDFCHVHLPPAVGQPAFHAGESIKPPHCPHCRRRFCGIAELLPDRLRGHEVRDCRSCGETSRLDALSWRRSACFARCIVNLEDIHESEAVPTHALMDALKGATGIAWDYCYIRN